MLHPPNYRISLKKNISLKTLADFNSLKRVTTTCGANDFKTKQLQKLKRKESFKNLFSTEKLASINKKSVNKTFCFDSSDQYIKRVLIANQWHLLPTQLPGARLKWVHLPKPQHFSCLDTNSLINHFKDSYKLTTKLGLYNLLSNPHQQTLTDSHSKNYLKYFPRSYDLGAQFDPFCSDFQHTAVLNLMKKLMIHIEILHQKSLYLKYKKICEGKCLKNSEELLAHNIENALKSRSRMFDKQAQEERIFINKTIFINLLKYWKVYFEGDSQKISCSSLMYSLRNYSKLNPPFTDAQIHFTDQSEMGYLSHFSAIVFFQLYFYCLQNNPYFLSDGLNNIWIIKSNESSRGRNIFLIDNIDQVQPYRNGGNKLIQKYIQNVWILNNLDEEETQKFPKIPKILDKKFDIRFWVLVKSFVPLEAYIFEEGYLRLSSQKYRFTQKDSLQKHLKTHLTNFSINFKPSIKKSVSKSDNQEDSKDTSYLLFSDFVNYIQDGLTEQEGKKSPKIFTKIQDKIQHVLSTASINWRQSQIDQNSFQLFGFDIILDSELEPYILECNMSPACQQRGELKNLAQQMGKGLLELIGAIKPSFSNPFDQKDSNCHQKLNIKNKWIRFQTQQNIEPLSRLQNISKGNTHDLCLIGESKTVKQLLQQDFRLDLVSKVILLQSFFKGRYISIKRKRRILSNTGKLSKLCLMIEALAKISKKRKHLWVKKFVKYVKKYVKNKVYQENINA